MAKSRKSCVRALPEVPGLLRPHLSRRATAYLRVLPLCLSWLLVPRRVVPPVSMLAVAARTARRTTRVVRFRTRLLPVPCQDALVAIGESIAIAPSELCRRRPRRRRRRSMRSSVHDSRRRQHKTRTRYKLNRSVVRGARMALVARRRRRRRRAPTRGAPSLRLTPRIRIAPRASRARIPRSSAAWRCWRLAATCSTPTR